MSKLVRSINVKFKNQLRYSCLFGAVLPVQVHLSGQIW